MRFRQLTDWLVYLGVRVFICIVQAVRMETCQTVVRWLAILACDVVRIRAAEVDENVRHVFPHWSSSQRKDFARRMWEHLFLMVCEIAHTQRKIHETNWRRYISLRGKRELVRYLLDPRPIQIVTGHFGNFELGGYITGMLGFQTFTVVRPLDNPYLDRFVGQFRKARGQHVLPKKGSSQQVESLLESGGKLMLLGDQHAGAKGCWVDFLGRPASCHKALALFTLTTGAPMLVSYAKRTGGPLCFEMGLVGVADPAVGGEELAGVTELTEWYNQMLERAIRTAPEQYWWIHRRWKGTPPPRRQAGRRLRRDAASSEPGSGGQRVRLAGGEGLEKANRSGELDASGRDRGLPPRAVP